jgi:hypothetical protein
MRLAIGTVGGETNSPSMVMSSSGGCRLFIAEMWRAPGLGSSPALLCRRAVGTSQ